jgi:MYXO-CTERM domain-containing protein
MPTRRGGGRRVRVSVEGMIVAGTTLGLGLGVFAHGGIEATTATDRFEPEMHQDLVGLEDVTVDTGWFPADSPVQLRLFVHAADSIVIEMPGDARYDWALEAIDVVGDPDAGLFAIDIGAQVEACVRFDVAGLTWESEILGPFDYAITSQATFSPYLLPGDPERPLLIEDATDGVTVASVPIVPDIVIASGGLDIDVAAEISASLQSARIEVLTAEANAAVLDMEGIAAALEPDPGPEALAAEGTLFADLQTAPTIIIRPHLVMSIAGQDFEIFGIDVPVALPPIDDTIAFAPEPLVFERPPTPPGAGSDSGDGDGGDGTGDGGDADGSEGTGDDGLADESGTSDGGDTSGGQISGDGSGCGCRSTRAPAGGLALLFGFLFVLRRRPSRRAITRRAA